MLFLAQISLYFGHKTASAQPREAVAAAILIASVIDT
jgi:hypothetical protein